MRAGRCWAVLTIWALAAGFTSGCAGSSSARITSGPPVGSTSGATAGASNPTWSDPGGSDTATSTTTPGGAGMLSAMRDISAPQGASIAKPAAAGSTDRASALEGRAAGAEVAESVPPDGTKVWGAGDQCLWVTAGGQWLKTGLCRVSDATYTWFYPATADPQRDWYEVALNPDQPQTSNGTQYVFWDKAFGYWESCPMTSCSETSMLVWTGTQWVQYATFTAQSAGQQAQQAQQQQSQHLGQEITVYVGGQNPLNGSDGLPPAIQNIVDQSTIRMNEWTLLPQCTSSPNGCLP